MSDVITTRKISRLEVIETLPPEVRDRALIDWRTFAIIFDRKDIEGAREWAIEQGIELVNTGRRKLPTWASVRKLIQARTFTPNNLKRISSSRAKKMLGAVRSSHRAIERRNV